MFRHLFILVFFSILTTVDLMGQNIIRWNTWEETIDKAQKNKKMIIVDVYTDWCGWCKRMEKMTFSENHIAKYINDHFYAVKFNAEMKDPIVLKGKEYRYVKNGKRGYHELALALLQGRLSYPSIVFMDENFNVIQAIPGFQSSEDFEKMIAYFATNSHKTTPWNRFESAYNRATYFNQE